MLVNYYTTAQGVLYFKFSFVLDNFKAKQQNKIIDVLLLRNLDHGF